MSHKTSAFFAARAQTQILGVHAIHGVDRRTSAHSIPRGMVVRPTRKGVLAIIRDAVQKIRILLTTVRKLRQQKLRRRLYCGYPTAITTVRKLRQQKLRRRLYFGYSTAIRRLTRYPLNRLLYNDWPSIHLLPRASVWKYGQAYTSFPVQV